MTISSVFAAAPYLLAAYLLVPTLLKAWLQPLVPVDLTLLLAVPTALVGLVWVALHWRDHRAALALWGALTAAVVVGVAWAPDSSLGLAYAARWIGLVALPLLAALPVAASGGRLRRFLVVFLGAGLALVILGLIVMPTVEAGELELLDTNRLGVARVVLLAPLVALPLAWRTRWAWAAVFLVPFAAFVAMGTGSRGAVFAFVGLLAALVARTLLRSPARARVAAMATAAVGAMFVLIVGMGWMLPEHAMARFGLLGDAVTQPPVAADPSPPPTTRDAGPGDGPEAEEPDPSDEPVGGESVAARMELAELALGLFSERPLVGHGTGGFDAIAAEEGLELYAHPHNLPLHFAADFGLLGLALAGVFAVVAARRLWPLDRPLTVALGLAFGFLILNAMLSNGIYENRMLWGVWLVVLAARRMPFARPSSVD